MNPAALLLFLQFAHPAGQHKAPHPTPAPPAPVEDGIFGTWMARDKSVFNIYPCGVTNGQPYDPRIACIRMLEPPKGMVSDTNDEENPDPTKRNRPLRTMIEGTNFKVTNGFSAKDGRLYDPDNGRTYRSTITLQGDRLTVHATRFLFFGHTLTCHRIQLAKPSPYKY